MEWKSGDRMLVTGQLACLTLGLIHMHDRVRINGPTLWLSCGTAMLATLKAKRTVRRPVLHHLVHITILPSSSSSSSRIKVGPSMVWPM